MFLAASVRQPARTICFAVVVTLVLSTIAHATTLRFKGTGVVTGGFVRLSDVAQIVDADPATLAKLAEVTLAPAPAPGQTLRLGHEAIRSRLTASGIDVSQIEFSGQSLVSVKSTLAVEHVKREPAPANEWKRQRLQRTLADQVGQYITSTGTDVGPIDVDVSLTAEQAAGLTSKSLKFLVSGGLAPWTGAQTFDVEVKDGARDTHTLQVKCQVQTRESVVHVMRSIRKGQLIGQTDVELRPAASGRGKAGLSQLSAVVGTEALRNLNPNETLTAADVKKVNMVQRNALVSVVSRVGSIEVTAEAKARSDGGLGDTVDLISLDGKQRYTGRVVGYHEVRTDPPRQPVTQLRVVPEIGELLQDKN